MKTILIFLFGLIFIMAGAVILVQRNDGGSNDNVPVAVANVEGGQLLEITAKGGYSPSSLRAKAGVPITLRVKTSGTFDCSSAISIPAIGYQKYLPASGVTDIPIPPQPAGTTLRGMCSMGMYNFSIRFDS